MGRSALHICPSPPLRSFAQGYGAFRQVEEKLASFTSRSELKRQNWFELVRRQHLHDNTVAPPLLSFWARFSGPRDGSGEVQTVAGGILRAPPFLAVMHLKPRKP